MSDERSLEAKLRRAGAVMHEGQSGSEARHFGSPISEMAALRRGVGLSLRSDLGLLALEGPERVIDDICSRRTGSLIALDAVSIAGRSFWARTGVRTVLIVCPRAEASRLERGLHDDSRRFAGLRVVDRSAGTDVLEILGRRTQPLISLLGVGPCEVEGRVLDPGAPTGAGAWLLATDELGLHLVDPAAAEAAWDSIASVGRTFGLGYVGIETAERFSLALGLELLRAPEPVSRPPATWALPGAPGD